MTSSAMGSRPSSVPLDGMERRVEAADKALLSLSASRNVERKKSTKESTSCLVDIAPRLTRAILRNDWALAPFT